MTVGKAGKEGPLRRIVQSIGERWPSLRFLSFAFYSAWILLAVSSSEAVSLLDSKTAGHLQATLYLSSGFALTASLVLSGVFYKRLQPAIERGPLVPAMGFVASVSTFVLMGGLGTKVGAALFVVCGIGTGVGTAFVCLRVGFITSLLNGVRAVMMVGSSTLLCNLLFFTCQALPPVASLWMISALPFLASVVSFCSKSGDEHGPEPADLIDIRSLPKGYFPRLMCVVFVFALAAGVSRGVAALSAVPNLAYDVKQSTWEVLFSFLAIAAFMALAAIVLAFRNFDMSKVYIPVCFATAAGMLLCPIFGEFLPEQGMLINVLYNIFILVVWCLLIELAGRTNLGAVRVFGFGRGASALATTLGWAVATYAHTMFDDPASVYTVFFLVMAFALLGAMALVLNEQTVSEALAKTMAIETGVVDEEKEILKAQSVEEAVNPWLYACQDIAAAAKLTARETEVYILLSRGRSISYIADELVIAPNTVKGYTKNVYAKLDVHSRQELIDMTEVKLAAQTLHES